METDGLRIAIKWNIGKAIPQHSYHTSWAILKYTVLSMNITSQQTLLYIPANIAYLFVLWPEGINILWKIYMKYDPVYLNTLYTIQNKPTLILRHWEKLKISPSAIVYFVHLCILKL